jgi:hypothetical protein
MATHVDAPMHATLWAPTSLALLVALLTPGCGGLVEDICTRECDCEACSDDDYDDCVSDGQMVEDDSKAAGCQKEFDAYSACADTNLVCEGNNSRVNGCFTEKATLTTCFICKRECDCEACSDDDYKDCVADGQTVANDSKAAGCQKEFDAYSACANTNLVCEGNNSTVNGCVTEKATLTTCVQGTSGGGS